MITHKKSFFLYYRQNLINVTITLISIHASLKGNYKSILKKLHRQVFIKSIKNIRENNTRIIVDNNNNNNNNNSIIIIIIIPTVIIKIIIIIMIIIIIIVIVIIIIIIMIIIIIVIIIFVVAYLFNCLFVFSFIYL